MSILVRVMKVSRATSTCLGCDGCQRRSRFVAGGKVCEGRALALAEKAGWRLIKEWQRTPTGRLKKRGSLVHHHYCPTCLKTKELP